MSRGARSYGQNNFEEVEDAVIVPKTTRYLWFASFFLLVGVTSNQLSDIICWFWLDDLQCWVQIACTVWDSVEYYIAHKLFAFMFYYVGWYGFTGSILYWIELRFFNIHVTSKLIQEFGNVFGWMIATIIGMIIINFIADWLFLDTLFESFYLLINT